MGHDDRSRYSPRVTTTAEDDSSAAPERIAHPSDPQLLILFAVTLIAVLGVASIGPALPVLRRELGVSVERVGLVVTLFTLPGVILTPLLGVVADRVGRKRVLVPSLALFAVAGGACGLAGSFTILLLSRLLQGVGGASLGALNVTLVGDLFRGRQRTVAMGYIAAVLSVGTAAYPLIGGGLASLSWRWPFVLPLLAAPVALLVAVRLEEPRVARPEGIGAYLGGLWREIRQPRVLALFGASCGIFILLYGAYITFLPLFMADRFGSSPIVIGAVMTSASAVNALTSSQLGRIARAVPEAVLLRLGFLSFALGLGLVPFIPSTALLLLPAVLLGFALATTIPVVLTLLGGLAPDDRRAAFMSFNGTVLRLGQTLGPLIATAVYAVGSYTAVYLAGAALALALGAAMAALVRR